MNQIVVISCQEIVKFALPSQSSYLSVLQHPLIHYPSITPPTQSPCPYTPTFGVNLIKMLIFYTHMPIAVVVESPYPYVHVVH